MHALLPSAPSTELRYALRTKLAKGGMGIIYLALDRIAQREVVYKQLWIPEPSQRALRTALFRREYDTLVRLPHPNIVEVYDYGESDGTPYYVMEHLGGADLASAAPLALREACRMLRDVASALALLHARRLVHRDVSPNNVRLTEQGTAKLLDFGALAPFGPADHLVGTPGFIAPESFASAALDQRSDLYALGALAYWALTRRTPYAARTLDDLERAFEHPPLPPSAHATGIPKALDELVLSLLAVDPHGRPASAAYVIDHLTSIASLEPEREEQRVAQSYLAHPPLVGREAALGALRAMLDGALAGRGSTLLVEGEAGLGRSALLAAAAQHAQLQGAVVLRARADGSVEPFRVARALIDAASSLYPDLAPAGAAHSSLHMRAPPARGSGAEVVERAERHALLLETAQRALLEASARAPLAVVVDDVHAADEPSRALILSLARALEGRPIALVLSSLPGRMRGASTYGAPLAREMQRVALSPLANTELGELVQALFGAVPNGLKLAHWLHAQSGGNPATALDLMRLLMQRGLIRYTLGTFTLPFEVDQLAVSDLGGAVLARLGDLPPAVAKLALTLSLHDGPLSAEQLATASALPEREVQLSLEELMLRGIVERSEQQYQLLGSSLRKALVQGAPEEAKRDLHRALARAFLAEAAREPRCVYDAASHLFEAGEEHQALDLVAGRAHRELHRQEAVHYTTLLERALARARDEGASKETCLSLLLPIASSGFHGSAQDHARHIETALAWMADVCGMSLASRLPRFLGGRLALVVGLLYAAFRRLLKPARERLGALDTMIAQFVMLVCDSTALAAACCDAAAGRRFVRWLDPLAVLPTSSVGGVMREFCIATCELACGQVDRGSSRYAALLPVLEKPLKGAEDSQHVLWLGTINGRGLCEASMGSGAALGLADALGSDAFFASFAEGIRFSYHALRGERESADQYRRRAELLALHGGISWTASSSLTQFTAYAATLAEDAIGLVQAISELERLADAGPKLRAYRLICEAWLAYVRGRPEEALSRFEPVIESEDAHGLSMVMVNRSLYASVLNALGLYERAEAFCTRAAADPMHVGEHTIGMRAVQRQRAVALAGLGRLAEGAALAEEQLTAALPLDNPLELGACHRDRARIALIARDHPGFDAHLAAMERLFHGTRNPCLRRQCELLLAAAEQSGLRTTPRTSSPTSHAQPLDSETYVEPSDSETYVEPATSSD